MNKQALGNRQQGISYKIILILIAIGFIAASCNPPSNPNPPMAKSPVRNVLLIAGHEVNVEIADTTPARDKGLSGRASLSLNDGMLFVFPEAGRHSFWMKDTNFALDLIWIHENKVVEITANVLPQLGVPDSELKIYTPTLAADFVLEVNAGWAAKNNIKVGDSTNLTSK